MRKLKKIDLLVLLPLLLAPLACLGSPGGGLFADLDFVDEDFDRPSPAAQLDGALTQQCSEPPGSEHYRKAQALQYALCLCGDLNDVGQGLRTRSFSRVLGEDGGLAHVGINGRMDVVGDPNIEGDLNVAGGLDGVGNLTVQGDLITGGDVNVTGDWGMVGDAWIDGSLSAVGSVQIGGDLYLTGGYSAVGDVSFDQARRGFSYRGAPCGCGSSMIVDVAAEVRSRKDSNDNASLPGGLGAQELTFRSGEYYIADPGDIVGARRLTIEGQVGLFIDGDLDTVGALNVDLAPGATLDLWVSGSVRTVGNLELANPRDVHARAFRLFMGGQGSSIMQVGSAAFYGAVYAPEVDIEYVGDLTVYGALFANNIQGTGDLTIFYDTDVAAPDPCAEDHPEPEGDDRCDAASDCGGGMTCDEVSYRCAAPRECEQSSDCNNGQFCVRGECTSF